MAFGIESRVPFADDVELVNYIFSIEGTEKIKLLLKNYRMSDDIAFRFGNKDWSEWPLTADKFAHWVNAVNGNGETINLFMDYETFGEHQWESTGIFVDNPDGILRLGKML